MSAKKISVARLTTDARHTVRVPLTLEDDAGNVEQIEARVVYRGISLREGAALGEALEGKTLREAHVTMLSTMVVALPDFVDDSGDPVAPTADFFDGLDTAVLNRINNAIEEDRDPNRKPSSS